MKQLLFIISILVFLAKGLYAEENLTQTIMGTVVDNVTGQPLLGATVIVIGSDPIIGTITDQNGFFKLQNIPLGRHGIEITYVGYSKITLSNLLLSSGKEVVVNVRMEEKPFEVEAVTIRPEKKKEEAINEMAITSARTFSVEETERFAGSLGDPARMVANYAGVMTQNDSRNDIIIRGNSPSGLLWRLEGIEIPNPNHFGALGTTGGPVSMINNNLLTNSDFLTGAFPAEYGNAIAGAFDLNLRSGNNQNTEFTGQVGFNGFEGGIEGPFKKKESGSNASYLANFRYSTLELLNRMGFDFGTGTAIPHYKDLTFLIDIPGTKAGRFKLFGLWGDSNIELGRDNSDTTQNAYNARGMATDFSSGLGVIGINHVYFLSEKARIRSTISWQRTSSKAVLDSLKESGSITKPFLRNHQSEDKISFTTQYRRKVDARNNFSLGLITDLYTINYIDSTFNNDYQRFLTNTDIMGNLTLLQAYGQYMHKFTNELTTYLGLHFQYSGFNSELTAEPRLGLKWQIGSRQWINLGFGMHSQLQPKVVYFTQEYDDVSNSYYRTNESLGFTRSNHYVAGYNLMLDQFLRLKLETYYQHLYRIPIKESFPEFSLINAGDQFGIPREDSLINKGTGRNYGLELTLEKFLNKGTYFLLTTSLFDSKYQGTDHILRNTAFDGNYVLNALGGYEFQLGGKTMLTIDIKAVFAGGKRYVPIDVEKSMNEGKEERDWTNAYAKKYDPYFRTDLRFGIKRNGRGFSQEWGIDLQNITGFRSIFTEGFDTETGEIYKAYQQGFVPMFLYRIQF